MPYVQYKNSKDYNPNKEYPLTPEMREELIHAVWDESDFEGLNAAEISQALNERQAKATHREVVREDIAAEDLVNALTTEELAAWKEWATLPWYSYRRWLYNGKHKMLKFVWDMVERDFPWWGGAKGARYLAIQSTLIGFGMIGAESQTKLAKMGTERQKIPFDEVVWEPSRTDAIYGNGQAWSSWLYITAEDIQRLFDNFGRYAPDNMQREAKDGLLQMIGMNHESA